MFKVGDRVITQTNDTLNEKLGTVVYLPEYPGANVLLDEDAEIGTHLHFFEDELRKVEA